MLNNIIVILFIILILIIALIIINLPLNNKYGGSGILTNNLTKTFNYTI